MPCTLYKVVIRERLRYMPNANTNISQLNALILFISSPFIVFQSSPQKRHMYGAHLLRPQSEMCPFMHVALELCCVFLLIDIEYICRHSIAYLCSADGL